MDMFANHLGVKVIRVDAVDDFMGKLAGVTDPEAKRKIIGKDSSKYSTLNRTNSPAPNGWRKARFTRRDRIRRW